MTVTAAVGAGADKYGATESGEDDMEVGDVDDGRARIYITHSACRQHTVRRCMRVHSYSSIAAGASGLLLGKRETPSCSKGATTV